MKRFRSRFSGLQRLREQQEKMAALAMMEAVSEERNYAQKHQQEHAQHSRVIDQTEQLLRQAYESGSLTSARSCAETTEQKVSVAEEELQSARKRLGDATKKRMLAYQSLQSVQKATEREVADHRKVIQAENLATRIDNIRTQQAPAVAGRSSRSTRRQKGQS